MSFLKFLFYVVAAYLVIRFINRLLSPRQQHRNQNRNRTADTGQEITEKPKFNIEADEIDYEIIEDEKEKDEK